MKTGLITGATGDVGTHLTREFAGKYKLRLSDKRPLKAKNFVKADVSKMADALKITKGVDADKCCVMCFSIAAVDPAMVPAIAQVPSPIRYALDAQRLAGRPLMLDPEIPKRRV